MPKTMGQLAIVQFFSWFALFSMWIYTTAAVTNHLYGTSDPTTEIYNEGANLVSGMFGWYNLFAAGFGLVILPFLAKLTNRKITHAISLVIGGLGLMSIYILKDPQHMIFSMIGVGMAWASILAMPYAILTGSLPQHKMGVYMGIFNFFIVIPQILAATILGFMVTHLFDGDSIFALITGGCSLLVAAVLILFVDDPGGHGKK
jgi:maltose/moltooligosaccharide transporter